MSRERTRRARDDARDEVIRRIAREIVAFLRSHVLMFTTWTNGVILLYKLSACVKTKPAALIDADFRMVEGLPPLTAPRGVGGNAAPMIWKHDERIIVYPPYIDSTRTTARGRRIAKSDAVEHPHVLEMRDAVERGLGLTCEIEDKAYSRDFWCRGRLRIDWKNADGTFVKKEYDSRGKVLKAIAAFVKKHPDRTEDGKPGTNPKYMTQHRVFEEYLKQVSAAGGPGPGAGKKAEKKAKGKKGRKK